MEEEPLLQTSAHLVRSRLDPSTLENKLNAFFASELVDPSGEFEGLASNGWISARRRGGIWKVFTFRGAINGEIYGSGSTLELLITPTLGTAIVMAALVVVVIVSGACIGLLSHAMYGATGGSSALRLFQTLTLVLWGVAITLSLRKARSVRRQLIRKLRMFGVVEQ